MRTIQELAQQAIDVQNACNLLGVLHGMVTMMGELREHLEKEGNFSTDKLNRHPIVQVWADKVASLANVQGYSNHALDAHVNVDILANSQEI